MGSKVLQAKFDQNLAKMLKKQPLYKKGSVRPHWGTKPVVLYKKSICTGHKATLFVEGIGRGIKHQYWLRIQDIKYQIEQTAINPPILESYPYIPPMINLLDIHFSLSPSRKKPFGGNKIIMTKQKLGVKGSVKNLTPVPHGCFQK